MIEATPQAPTAPDGPPARDPLTAARADRLVVFAPNWLGDAVMALPALADVRRANAAVSIAVVARPAVAPLFAMVAGIQDVVALDTRGPIWRDLAGPLRERRFDAALLLPNSFHAAWIAARAGIPHRWGYAADLRRALLTRAVSRPWGVHQGAYYQHLTRALGFPAGPLEPAVDVSTEQRARGGALLAAAGWNERAPLVAFAPGAAYGGAKKWAASAFAAVAADLARDGIVPVLVGSAADAPAGAEVEAALGGAVRAINLIGRTDLAMLAAVLAASRGLVSNDSGAMHLAAAIGVPVTAIFGPTNEAATHPLGRAPHVVLTHDVWCRPCMLRECPLRHGCMRGVTPGAVATAARTMW